MAFGEFENVLQYFRLLSIDVYRLKCSTLSIIHYSPYVSQILDYLVRMTRLFQQGLGLYRTGQ